MTKHSPISSEEVMNAFAMDFEPGTNVLKQYLADYPQFAGDLVDLARELSRQIDQDLPLSSNELAAVEAKMIRVRQSAVTVQTLLSASPKSFAQAAKVLGLPMQVGIAIRERRIEVSTLPKRFLRLLASALQAPVAVVQSFLLLPAQASVVRANKSAEKPILAEKVPFERILREAGMDEVNVTRLLSDDE